MSSDKIPLNPVATKPDGHRYRVHFLNPSGMVLRIKPIEASSDELAIERAKQLMDGRALDLWDGLRFVETFPINSED